jgi:hypothetical protein
MAKKKMAIAPLPRASLRSAPGSVQLLRVSKDETRKRFEDSANFLAGI